MEKILNYIDGKFGESVQRKWMDNVNPAAGHIYSRLPDSDGQDVEHAVQAARRAFAGWSQSSVETRATFLEKLANLLERDKHELAKIETVDTGKPISVSSTVDIPRSIQNFRFFASAIRQFASESHHDLGQLNYTLRDPVGIVACISPWNLPLYLLSWKIAPALAAGNTVVAKPSEVTPMSAYVLTKLAHEAGLPPGVLNIVYGHGNAAGEALVAHPDVKAISFTGGTNTGKRIGTLAGAQLKKVSLELGGKNPNIIFADCDFEKALDTTVRSSFANQGQICLCGSRILVERSIFERFADALASKAKDLKIGDPLDPNTQQGAVVSQAHYQKIIDAIEDAKRNGAKILTGGKSKKVSGLEGWFIEPTIMTSLTPDCRTNMEEIFGPVVTLTPFDNDDEALKLANMTTYGLSASVWTNNLHRAHQFAKQLQAGIVWINTWMLRDLRTPFGGTKNSGVGREGGVEALRFFTEPKNVCLEF
ncbi:MAG: aldehyde dehydrogenase [Oligoflexales bacterium]